MDDKDGTPTRLRPKRTTFVSEATWTNFGEFKAGIIGRKGESAVAQVLSALGVPALHDALLSDLLGVTQLDHLVRASDAIMVIETKTYGGHITGTLDSAEWVQQLNAGETRHAFQNPVHQNFRHCRAVEVALAGLDVAVVGIIVSAGSATFCDALNGAVIPLQRLGEVFRPLSRRSHDPRHLELAWERIGRVVGDSEPRREEHREVLRQRRDNGAG